MRAPRAVSLCAIALALAPALASCDSASPPSAAEPTASLPTASEPTATEPTVSRSASPEKTGGERHAGDSCSNEYFAAVEGSGRTYEVSTNLAAPAKYTDVVTDVAGDGFTVISEFPGLTREVRWGCSREGLESLDYGGGGAANVSSAGVQGGFQTSDSSGVTLPRRIRPGDRWAQSFEFTGTIQLPGGGPRGEADGGADYRFQAGEIEQVSVPAGRFDAVAIDFTLDMRLEVRVSGVEVPVDVATSGTTWWAPDVGVVRSESSGEFGGSALTEETVLTGFDV